MNYQLAAEPLKFVLDEIEAVSRFGRGPILREGMAAAKKRRADFSNDLEMYLTGLGIDPGTRRYADDLLDQYWAKQRTPLLRRLKGPGQQTKREVIIGSGFHAAAYAAVRVASGFPRPIVVDQAERAGGIFAMTRRPLFYLNSSNRPGGPGFVQDFGAQPNYLPGAPVQPSNLSSAEFETNADMAWVIRMTLAQNAEVLTGFKIDNFRSGFFGERPMLIGADGSEILVARVIDARGLGAPRDLGAANGTTVLTFPQFMERMDQPWPLRGVQRVAVIGDGDAARVSVEQLVGVGPQVNLAMANDRVELIDWYGKQLPSTPSDWRNVERTRYLPIAKFLSNGKVGTRKVRVFNRRVRAVALPDQALVQGRSYDLVVLATGWSPSTRPPNLGGFSEDLVTYSVGDLEVGRVGPSNDTVAQVFRVGPHARLGFNRYEEADDLDRKTNEISMSRLGPKTAALAASLPEPNAVGDRLATLAA